MDKVVEVDFFEEARTPSQHLLEVAYVYVVLVLLAPHPVVALLASVQVDALLGDGKVLSRALCWFSSSCTVPRNIEAAAIPAIVALLGSRFVEESRRVRWGLLVHKTIIWTILAEKGADKGVTLVATDQLLSIEARL